MSGNLDTIFDNPLSIFKKSFEQHHENKIAGIPKFKFYIPSKNRYDVMTTHKVLKNIGIDCIIVVEPNDEENYRKFLPNETIIVMDKNNQGIYYVRNYIKDYSLSNGEDYHWQLDDDIRWFKYIFNGTRYKITDNSPFMFAENLVTEYPNIGIAGFIHGAFAFAQKYEFVLNRQVCSCTIVNNRIPVRWNPNIIEDTDYTLQLLYSNYCTLNINIYSYDTPPAMKLKGGNLSDFQNNGFYLRQKALSEKYPGNFEIIDKNGISRIKPSKIWSKFKTEPIKI